MKDNNPPSYCEEETLAGHAACGFEISFVVGFPPAPRRVWEEGTYRRGGTQAYSSLGVGVVQPGLKKRPVFTKHFWEDENYLGLCVDIFPTANKGYGVGETPMS